MFSAASGLPLAFTATSAGAERARGACRFKGAAANRAGARGIFRRVLRRAGDGAEALFLITAMMQKRSAALLTRTRLDHQMRALCAPRLFHGERIAQAIARGWAAIDRLLLHGRPSAVSRRVSVVVIDALQRQSRSWPAAHVRDERGEVMAPSIAHGDAAAAVTRVRLRVRIDAALNHRLPDVIFRPMTARQSVRCSERHMRHLNIEEAQFV